MGDWVRRAAVGYYRANVNAWDGLKRVIADPDGGILIGLLLLAATIGLAFSGHQAAAWATVGAMVALVVVREVGA